MYLCDSASIELYEFPINSHNFPFQNYEAQSAGSGAEVLVPGPVPLDPLKQWVKVLGRYVG